ncbi:S9 family peptidase [Paraglaciecola sp. L3A3]|uniref:alpha/beta hydrolase family protein n=1 Tax=Paraglaciecola sp. L3A3 TaxID=2686358 RepID=UPI00131EAE13|nr:prolyl oligopeptidase family serine peptidase [Paraglaciecola sp. L3A3]
MKILLSCLWPTLFLVSCVTSQVAEIGDVEKERGNTAISQSLPSVTPVLDGVRADMTALANATTTPKVYDAVKRDNGITELYLEGQHYQGKPTRIFALYSAPQTPYVTKSGEIPAVVLVHGGGGSAFEQWVTKWNDAGFAAISIAVEGQTDQKDANNKWQKHAFSGPARAAIYGDADKPISEQWMYHAVSATITARKFLASQPNISKSDIGLSGISWGGVITSTVIGFDPSFKFAIPVYGNGFLDQMDNQYGRSLAENLSYKNVWEPGLNIEQYKNPSLWLTWRNDVHFALDAQAKTYGLLSNNVANSIKLGIRHGHIAGWKQPESYFFAHQVINNNASWVESRDLILTEDNTASATFQIKLSPQMYTVQSAKVNFTAGQGHTGPASWQEMSASWRVKSNGTITVEFENMPKDVTHWFINIEVDIKSDSQKIDEALTVSSAVYSANT